MFSRSRNFLITGGTYTVTDSHFHEARPKGIDVLLEASAPGAFHNSGERFDPPKCHPETRIHILTKIMNWVIGKVGWDGLIMWLYGPAGAGKSAIAQTIAERCYARHLLLASFFFSRTDPKRNDEKSLIASIAYQIALNLPEARDAIEAAVERDPAIFHSSIKVQLTTLIIDPLTQLSKAGFFHSNPVPYLIIIDGLDECRDRQIQQYILHAVSGALQQPYYVPLMFLICSRAEQHLTLEFTSLISGGIATRLSLDDGYEQNADIERYLMDSFHKISTTHPLKEYIPRGWPTHAVLSTLVKKSSGQFIYAATVVKYISSNRHQPMRRLEIVLGMQPPRNDLPFAELDALYIGILSSVEDVKATIRLLGVLILVGEISPLEGDHPKSPQLMGEFMFVDPGELQCLLIDLASVVECVDKDTEIRILHASFPDFLLDRSRSGEYYIDSSVMHAEMAQLCLLHINAPHDSKHCETCCKDSQMCCLRTDYAYSYISCHLEKAEPSADLREALLNPSYITSLTQLEHAPPMLDISDLLPDFLSFLKGSKFANTEELYLHHRNIFDRIIRKKIADFSFDLEFIEFLVFIEMQPRLEILNESCFDALYFTPHIFLPYDGYYVLLGEYLTDPVRAGEYVLDGPKYALVARSLLNFFIQPCSKPKFLDYLDCTDISRVLSDEIETLLSKASYSDELVGLINHTNLTFDTTWLVYWMKRCNWEEILPTLINGIGDYLMRVVGSVPIGLHITLKTEEGEGPSYYYDTDFV